MSTSRYTEEQKDRFVERASQIGSTPAMRELGYPVAKATASIWCKARGVRASLTELQTYAASVNQFYGAKEKLAICQRLLDECYDILVHGEPNPEDSYTVVDEVTGSVAMAYHRKPLTASVVSRISATVQRTITTMELLEGRVTDRIEIATDATDIELAEMIREYKAKNAVAIEELRAR